MLMPCCRLPLLLLFLLPAPVGAADPAMLPADNAPREIVSTAAVVEDGVLYAASYEAESRAGHLRAFALSGSREVRLWDAAERIPVPGGTLPPATDPGVMALAPQFSDSAGLRQLFTNLDATQGFRLLTFDARAAHVLQSLLGEADVAATAALINAVRGRLGTASDTPGGDADRPDRLGAISRSSPALVGGSPFATAWAYRDQVLYVGAEDGLLHAILAGRWSGADGRYDHAASDCGRELWAYLPGSLLPHLANGQSDPRGYLSPVHVDGSPVVSDMFIDGDGDGRREWRTVLVGTASAPEVNRGVVFALDVTDPHAPRLLWETALAEIGLGRSRGAAISSPPAWTDTPPRVFLTAVTATRINADGTPNPLSGSFGVLACALDLASGTLLWTFTAPGEGSAGELAEPPTAPAVMTAATSGGVDGVLFGDLAGRLWSLDPVSGAPLGGRPVWQSPGGAAEPIGGGFALRNRLVLFGTGGVEHADPDRSYAVYAVELLPEGGRLLWSHPLLPDEKLWGAPTLDRFGRAFFGVGAEQEEDGRLLVLATDGTLSGSLALAGAPSDGVTLAPGVIVTVSRSGQVEQIGELQLATAQNVTQTGRVRVYSWRMR